MMLRHRKTDAIISVVMSISMTVSPVAVTAQNTPEFTHADAQAALGSLYWYIDEMRARVDDAAFDPDTVAYALHDDPDAIFNFVQREIAYQPYPGLLRFGSGTLMNLAGNSCDQAALLGEMLLAGGHEVRFVTAPMTPNVQSLLLETAQNPATAFTAPDAFTIPDAQDREDLYWLGYSDANIDEQVAQAVLQTYSMASELDFAYDYALSRLSPFIEASLSADSGHSALNQSTHCWVQLKQQDEWQDLDAAAWWLPAGARALEPAEIHPDGLPLSLAPTLNVQLLMDKSVGETIERAVILDATSSLFRPVNEMTAVFVPTLADGSAAPDDGHGNTFLLQLAINGHQTESLPFDLNGNAPPPLTTAAAEAINSAADVISNIFGGSDTSEPEGDNDGGGLFGGGGGLFGGGGETEPEPTPEPEKSSGGGLFGGGGIFGGGGSTESVPEAESVAAESALQRLTLQLTLADATGTSHSEQRVLMQMPSRLEPAQITADIQKQLTTSYEAVIWGGRIEKAYVDARDLDNLLAAQSAYAILLDANYGVEPDVPVAQIVESIEPVNVALLEAARLRSALVEHAAAGFAANSVHIGFPQMMAVRTGYVPSETGADARLAQIRDIVSNGLVVAGPDASRLHSGLGIIDTLIEYLLDGGGNGENLFRVLVAADDQSVDLALLKAGATDIDASINALGPSPLAAMQMRADLDNGFDVISPNSPIQIGDRHVAGWLRIDPVSGESLGRGAMGGQDAAETTALQAAIAQQKATLPWSLALCGVFTAFSHEIGSAIMYAAGEPTPPAAPRSTRRVVVEYVACVLLSHLAMGGVQGIQAAAAARGAAAAAAAGGGALGTAAAGRARPAPPVAARPQSGARPPAASPSPELAGARPGAARPAGRGSNQQRPASGANRRPANFDVEGSTTIDRPARGSNLESGTYVDGETLPPPRNRPNTPRTAPEQFDQLTNQLFGENAYQRHNLPISRGRWESMTPVQRRASLDAYRALRRADPAGNPVEQFKSVVENGRDFSGTPAEQVAQGVLDSTLSVSPGQRNPGVNLRQLADAAGVTPQQMRQMLEARLAQRTRTGQRIEVGPDGQVRVRPREPLWENLSSHERQLAEMSGQDPRNAARNARSRAAVDAERGLSIEESVAGQAHHEQVGANEYLSRTGQTRAEGEAHLSRYLERQGLSPENARMAAREYFNEEPGPQTSFDTLPPPDRGPGSAGGRGSRNTPAPERGARSPFESSEPAPFETQRLTPDQMRRAVQEADTVRIEPEQVRQLAEQGETIRMTPEELRAITERSDTIRMSPEQQRQIAEGADTVNLTAEQMRAMADGSETVRMTPEELRAVAERSDTVRMTSEQQRRIAEINETARLSPEEAGARRPDPPPVPEREIRNPDLPAEREFQTPESAQRAREPDGLLPAEREEMALLDRRIAENRNELVPENQELNQLAERTLMEHERSAIAGRGEQFQKRLALRQRQGSAPQHEIPAGSPAIDRPQPTINAGRTPRRYLVAGDSDYLNAIMSDSRFEASQNHIFSETVNSNVGTILQEGTFPTGHNGNPQQVHLLQVGPNRYIIQNGHHRIVAAEIAARLSGRPLLPGDAIGTGLEPIIPADRLVIRTQEGATQGSTQSLPARDTRGWRQVGVN